MEEATDASVSSCCACGSRRRARASKDAFRKKGCYHSARRARQHVPPPAQRNRESIASSRHAPWPLVSYSGSTSCMKERRPGGRTHVPKGACKGGVCARGIRGRDCQGPHLAILSCAKHEMMSHGTVQACSDDCVATRECHNCRNAFANSFEQSCRPDRRWGQLYSANPNRRW